MKEIDRSFTQWPFYGSRKVVQELARVGHGVMGLQALVADGRRGP